MTRRIAIGGISHETNQYVTAQTGREPFFVVRGAELVRLAAGLQTYIGGLVDQTVESGWEPVGLLYAQAPPSGPIEHAAYEELRSGLLQELRRALPVQGVLLELHGAGATTATDDLEGDLCSAVRQVVGPAVPVVVVHDLHGNLTQAEVSAVDMLFAVHHYPHDDAYERGREAAAALGEVLAGRWEPTAHLERLPMLLPPTTTYSGVGARVLEMCRKAEETAGVLDCVFMHGFPFTDNPHVGSQVVVTTHRDPGLARTVARRVAAEIWDMREDFLTASLDATEAVEAAYRVPRGPVVVNETSDNPGGGAPGDGTHLLRALLARPGRRTVFSSVNDPDVAALAHAAGVGASLTTLLGGKTDGLHGSPLAVDAVVTALSDGKGAFESPAACGVPFDLGASAALRVGHVDVVVTSRAVQTIDQVPMRMHGLDALGYDIIAVKSSGHFRSAFEQVGTAIVTADPPGLTTTRLSHLPRHRSPEPLWPLDRSVVYPGRDDERTSRS